MMPAVTTSVARQLESLFGGGSVAGLSDRQLLDRFVAGRDSLAAEAAFAAIVARHGPMVLGVCRQILGDGHDADDAFQAVFLVLARRARSIRDPDLLGNWLYGVALRTARGARRRVARGRRREAGFARQRPEASVAPPAEHSAIEREQAEALHAEIDRLPATTRLPVVLCYLEGLSLAEAAERLRCPAGTVHSRLDRAREALRRGLRRRGIVLSTTAIAAMLAPRSASASVPPLLCDSTTRAALHFAARHAAGGALSAPAAELAQEALRTMIFRKLKLAAMTVLTLAVVATGAGFMIRSLPLMKDGNRTPSVQGPPGRGAAPGRMLVEGRALDPEGRPMPGVPIDLVGQTRTPQGMTSEGLDQHVILGGGVTDAEGHFRLDVPRTSSTGFLEVYVSAARPGLGFAWAKLNPDAERPTAEIHLQHEQPIRGRVVDVTGRPAAGVEVRVESLAHPPSNGIAEGIASWGDPLERLRTWPRPVRTDQEGKFALASVGRDLTVGLEVRDLRFARQVLRVRTDRQDGPKEVTLAPVPAQIIEGRLLADDTGRPIPNAMISVASGRGQIGSFITARFRTDNRGRFIINPPPGEYLRMSAYPAPGQPYLARDVEFAWSKGMVRKAMDITLPRGVLIQGKVTEEKTGRPLRRASVQYIPTVKPGNATGDRADIVAGWRASVTSREDGSFQIAVPPGRGQLLVFDPSFDHVLKEVGFYDVAYGQPGGPRRYAHAIIPFDVKAGDPPLELTAELRPSGTLRGRIIGPGGQAINDAVILTRLLVDPINLSWDGRIPFHARDGFFELHGVAPDQSTPVYFLDTDHEWGVAVELSGKQAGEDLTIRLQPNGRAEARLVGPDGKPLAGLNAIQFADLEVVVTPGPVMIPLGYSPAERHQLAADAGAVANVDRQHYWDGPKTDADGRFTLPDLIPGALYRISDPSTGPDPAKGVQVRKEFNVKPGETLDLGEILIEKPPG